jgi:hypothetical protein
MNSPIYIVQFFAFFSKSTFYVLSTSPRLVRFLNSTIPWEHKIRTIQGPPVFEKKIQKTKFTLKKATFIACNALLSL